MGVNPSTGFTQVRPTADEKAAWDKKYPRQAGHYPYRSECLRCGRRIWHSGIAIGSHRRACKGASTAPESVTSYFAHRRECAGDVPAEMPQIVQAFMDRPGNRGWTDVMRRPATWAEIRILARQGASTLGITAYDGPIADFPIAPLLAEAERPLLGGALIGSKTRNAQ